MVEKYDSIDPGPVSIDKEKGFGPECHVDEGYASEEPQENTKMVI